MKNASININQRIPLDILYSALQTYLSGTYDENHIAEQLSAEFKGQNRIKKATNIISKIVCRNPLDEQIRQSKAEIQAALARKADRNLILISLLNSSYVFSFDVLRSFGKYLGVQQEVGRKTIMKELAAKYGGNRATPNGIDSVVPMFIEAGLIYRPKIGIYSKKSDIPAQSPISKQLYQSSYDIHHSTPATKETKAMDPYFFVLKQ